ncbi:MAG: hypothetical protein Q9207_002108 [Kuettlingeria erythrocarpa]
MWPEHRNFELESKRLKGYVDGLMEMYNLLSQHWGRKLDSALKNPGMDVHAQFMRQQKEVLQRKIKESIDELGELINFVHYGGLGMTIGGIFQTPNLEYVWYLYQANKVAHNENEIVRINGDYLHLHCVLARLQKLSTARPECTDVVLLMWRLEMAHVRDKVQAQLGELEAINGLFGQASLTGGINCIGPVRMMTRERAWRISNETPYLCRSECPKCWQEEGLLERFRWENKTSHRLNPRAPCFVMRDCLG